MELPDSYEAMYQRAKETAVRDRNAGIEQFQRLVNRLLSLPARVLDRRPDLRELLEDVADDYLVLLRWAGRNEEALAEIDRLSRALPEQGQLWLIERALNLIDSGRVGDGLDVLQALLLQRPPNERAIRKVLANELLGTGQYAEAMNLAKVVLRDTTYDDDRADVLALLVRVAIEADDRAEVVRYTRKLRKELGTIPYFILEWLAVCGHWEELGRLLDSNPEPDVRQVFRGEMCRALGDEAGVRALWDPLFESEDVELYAFVAVRLLTGQADDDVERELRHIVAAKPEDSTALLALVAALAQMGRIEEAVREIVDFLEVGRLARPRWKRLPHSYWLRLRRYPMPAEAVEALRPYFVTERAVAPA